MTIACAGERSSSAAIVGKRGLPSTKSIRAIRAQASPAVSVAYCEMSSEA
jgi:hypothetical protein